MEKIKINLDTSMIAKLNDDVITFGYFKTNGNINRNGFLNTLLKNYFPIYDKIAASHIERYTKIITKHIANEQRSNEIINSLIASNKLFSYNKKDKLESSINFKPSNSNLNIINIIYGKYLNFQSLSSFFRNMFEHYLSLPQYKREQIIYLDNYELILESIEKKRKIIVCLNNQKKEIIPYKMVTNKEEIYNYLICLSKSQRATTIMSLHLYKIKYIYVEPEKFTISDEEKEKLERVIKSSPQFPFYNDEECHIKLTKEGIKLYNKKYLNRPTPYKIENENYYFNCSYTQIILYFFPFGKEAKIIEPLILNNLFKTKYLEAYNSYLEE